MSQLKPYYDNDVDQIDIRMNDRSIMFFWLKLLRVFLITFLFVNHCWFNLFSESISCYSWNVKLTWISFLVQLVNGLTNYSKSNTIHAIDLIHQFISKWFVYSVRKYQWSCMFSSNEYRFDMCIRKHVLWWYHKFYKRICENGIWEFESEWVLLLFTLILYKCFSVLFDYHMGINEFIVIVSLAWYL